MRKRRPKKPEDTMIRLMRKADFVHKLARFLVDDQDTKFAQAQVAVPLAREWKVLREMVPLYGYPTVEEAELELEGFLK